MGEIYPSFLYLIDVYEWAYKYDCKIYSGEFDNSKRFSDDGYANTYRDLDIYQLKTPESVAIDLFGGDLKAIKKAAAKDQNIGAARDLAGKDRDLKAAKKAAAKDRDLAFRALAEKNRDLKAAKKAASKDRVLKMEDVKRPDFGY